jgi:hypothetical protein
VPERLPGARRRRRCLPVGNFEFPVAIDKDWATLRTWWLDGHERGYTSVSFLIDKAGVVRRVHLGGTIAPEGDDIRAINADVDRLLAE